MTPAMGVPMTEAPTEAIPHKAKAEKLLANPIDARKPANVTPAAAPINSASEKTPPKNPVDKQIAVTKSFRNKKIITQCMLISIFSIELIVEVPIPRTSGKIIPIEPQIKAPTKIK